MTVKTADAAPAVSDFDKLIGEITAAADVVKAMPADMEDKGGKKGKKDDKEGDDADKIAAAAEEDDEDEGEDVAKGFDVTLADGTTMKAVDGAPMFKALTERAERAEKTLDSVWTVVKSLQAEVGVLKAAPRGRKTIVSISERTPAATATDVVKSELEGMPVGEFMAKALLANTEGRINGFELTKIENVINSGKQPDPVIVKRILAAK